MSDIERAAACSPKRVYVASSWRNAHQPAVVEALRCGGHDVYDFRHPAPGDDGFAWSEIDPDWLAWTPEAFRRALEHPRARAGFRLDADAVEACDACVLVLPCGRSAHLEAGFAAGRGKEVFVLMLEPNEPELMYRWAKVCLSVEELLHVLTKGGVGRDSGLSVPAHTIGVVRALALDASGQSRRDLHLLPALACDMSRDRRVSGLDTRPGKAPGPQEEGGS